MSKIIHTCSECESEFIISYDENINESDPTYCPFCGEYLFIDDSIQDDE